MRLRMTCIKLLKVIEQRRRQSIVVLIAATPVEFVSFIAKPIVVQDPLDLGNCASGSSL